MMQMAAQPAALMPQMMMQMAAQPTLAAFANAAGAGAQGVSDPNNPLAQMMQGQGAQGLFSAGIPAIPPALMMQGSDPQAAAAAAAFLSQASQLGTNVNNMSALQALGANLPVFNNNNSNNNNNNNGG